MYLAWFKNGTWCNFIDSSLTFKKKTDTIRQRTCALIKLYRLDHRASLILSKNVYFPWFSLILKRDFEIPWSPLIFPDAGHPEYMYFLTDLSFFCDHLRFEGGYWLILVVVRVITSQCTYSYLKRRFEKKNQKQCILSQGWKLPIGCVRWVTFDGYIRWHNTTRALKHWFTRHILSRDNTVTIKLDKDTSFF